MYFCLLFIQMEQKAPLNRGSFDYLFDAIFFTCIHNIVDLQ